MLHMLQWLYIYVASFCSQCFICFFFDVCCKCVSRDVVNVFTHMMQVSYLNVAYVHNGFKCFFKCFRRMFQIFIYFQTYVATVASECFKSRSDVASPSSPFCCLASVSGVRSERWWRRSPLARVGLTCLRTSAVDEMWAGRHGTRDGEQRRGRRSEC
jgi:hypothetical protein